MLTSHNPQRNLTGRSVRNHCARWQKAPDHFERPRGFSTRGSPITSPLWSACLAFRTGGAEAFIILFAVVSLVVVTFAELLLTGRRSALQRNSIANRCAGSAL